MRITNKMMTNNMLSNINKNKLNLDTLEQQYSTGKKIQKPSDDPIIAVRALKLRTNLSELTQYYEKNIPDAQSWMDVTEGSLKNINEIIKQVNTYCVQGSSDTLTATNRSSIAKNLEQLKSQIYQEGNTTYAGRYVFSGYKTDSSLTFTEDVSLPYTITENFTGDRLQMTSRVLNNYSQNDLDNASEDFSDVPQLKDIYRLQLSYDNLDNADMKAFTYTASGATNTVTATKFASTDANAYVLGDDDVHYIYDTGEVVMGKNVYDKLKAADSISVEYAKTNFENGDLKPEHYFNCERTDTSTTYTKSGKQEIQYEVNYNQKLTINTEGSEAISHNIGRTIDDILNSVNEVKATEDAITEINKRLSDSKITDTEKTRLESALDQFNTELSLKKEIMQKKFTTGINDSNDEQDMVNTALADLGSRSKRLELTENRLSSQKTDFEDLLSKNEDADMTDTIVNYYSAMTVYNSSLSAAAKVVKNSLLDFL